MVLTTVFLSVR